MAKVWAAALDLSKALVAICREGRAAKDIPGNIRTFWAILESAEGANVVCGVECLSTRVEASLQKLAAPSGFSTKLRRQHEASQQVNPGPLESWDDVEQLFATLVFMKLTHSLTRCFHWRARLLATSTLAATPTSEWNAAAAARERANQNPKPKRNETKRKR